MAEVHIDTREIENIVKFDFAEHVGVMLPYYAAELKALSVAYAESGFSGSAQSVVQHFKNMSVGKPYASDNGAFIEVKFTDDLSRPSLNPRGEPLHNVILYMATGSTHPQSTSVVGMWHGQVVRGAAYHPPVNPLQDAADMFNLIHAGDGVYAEAVF